MSALHVVRVLGEREILVEWEFSGAYVFNIPMYWRGRAESLLSKRQCGFLVYYKIVLVTLWQSWAVKVEQGLHLWMRAKVNQPCISLNAGLVYGQLKISFKCHLIEVVWDAQAQSFSLSVFGILGPKGSINIQWTCPEVVMKLNQDICWIFHSHVFRQVFETMRGLSAYPLEGYCGCEKFPELRRVNSR